MAIQTKEEKLALIKENLDEVLDQQIIDEVLDSGRNLKVYWGKVHSPFCVCDVSQKELVAN